MKKYNFKILLIILFPMFTSLGQEQIDVIYLNNGDIAKGLIVENIPDDYVKIELIGGSIFTFKYSDILMITKEESSTEKPSNDSQHQNDILSSPSLKQIRKGDIGVTASLQVSQFDFLVPFFLRDNLSLSPAFGFSSDSDVSLISLGAIFRYYFSKNIVSPFIGGRLGMVLLSPKNGDVVTNLVLGPLAGGEYFYSKNFSVGIELQINILNSFGSSSSIKINTGTAFFATIFF